MPFDAILYDGQSGHRQDVRVDVHPDAIDLTYDSGNFETVDAKLLTRIDSDKKNIRLGRTDESGWRLVVPASAEPEIRALVAREPRYGRWVDRIGLAPALVTFGIVAASVVAIGYLAPQWIAPHVPESWERNLGTAIVGDFGDNRCRSADGQRALEALAERVAPGSTRGPDAIKFAAIDYSIFNAAALPGSNVIFFKTAITESDPDALAGIMAHEIAHVRRRHVTEALIRELGIGALIRLFAGDIGANAQQIVALSYTRGNESEADADAIAMLKRAGIDPRPTAKLFQEFASKDGGGTFYNAEFLQSHPLSEGRAMRFAASFDGKAAYRPSLPEAQADQLFNICWKKPEKR